MALTKDEIIEAIAGMTVLEVSELVKAMEEKFGVTAAAPVAVAAAPGAGGGEAAVEEDEQTEFTVTLTDFGEKKINVIKAVRTVVDGLGLKEAKELVESKGTIRENVSKEEAAKIKETLEAAGATVAVK